MADDLAKELLIGFEEGVLQLYSCYIRTREMFPELLREDHRVIEAAHKSLDVLSILAYVCCYPMY